MQPDTRRSVTTVALELDEPIGASGCPTDQARSGEPANRPHRVRQRVLQTSIDVVDWTRAVDTIMSWGAERESRTVAVCNAHSLVTAQRDPTFRRVLEDMDMTTADGMSVAWVMRRLGRAGQPRVNGPDLMLRCCARAEQERQSVYLFGNTPETLDRLGQRLLERFPDLRIAGAHSPPFRPATEEENRLIADEINASGANLVFVSLGCPKQERWMYMQSRRIAAVMLGVGAAFEFHSGMRPRAPQWMQDAGIEWLFRMVSEPRRLTGRYVSTNLAFIAGAAKQLHAERRNSGGQRRR